MTPEQEIIQSRAIEYALQGTSLRKLATKMTNLRENGRVDHARINDFLHCRRELKEHMAILMDLATGKRIAEIVFPHLSGCENETPTAKDKARSARRRRDLLAKGPIDFASRNRS